MLQLEKNHSSTTSVKIDGQFSYSGQKAGEHMCICKLVLELSYVLNMIRYQCMYMYMYM